MPVQNGDLVKVEYTAYVKSNSQVVDTTDENKAKQGGIYDPKKKYGPAVIKVGGNEVLEGVDEGLINAVENQDKTFDVLPEKAFGTKDDGLVKIVPIRQFRQAGMNPVPGQVVNIDSTPATIKAVNSGRVVVDFNHPLAGVTLKYDVKVLRVGKTLEEKAKLLTEKYEMKCEVEVKGEEVTVNMGTNQYDEKRARDSAAVALVARELKGIGAKKVSFNGTWTF